MQAVAVVLARQLVVQVGKEHIFLKVLPLRRDVLPVTGKGEARGVRVPCHNKGYSVQIPGQLQTEASPPAD